MKKLLIGFFCFLGMVNVLSADECDYKDIKDLNVLAAYVDTTYDYNESTQKFDLHILNVPDELYVRVNSKEYNPSNNEIVVSGFSYGEQATIVVYGSSNSKCYREELRTINYTFPYLNYYYEKPICEGHETLDVCKYRFLPYEIDYDTLISLLQKDIDRLSKEEEEKEKLEAQEKEENKSFFEQIVAVGSSLSIPVILVILSSGVTFLIGNIIERKIKHGL